MLYQYHYVPLGFFQPKTIQFTTNALLGTWPRLSTSRFLTSLKFNLYHHHPFPIHQQQQKNLSNAQQ
jgi:hypothetical protein